MVVFGMDIHVENLIFLRSIIGFVKTKQHEIKVEMKNIKNLETKWVDSSYNLGM